MTVSQHLICCSLLQRGRLQNNIHGVTYQFKVIDQRLCHFWTVTLIVTLKKNSIHISSLCLMTAFEGPLQELCFCIQSLYLAISISIYWSPNCQYRLGSITILIPLIFLFCLIFSFHRQKKGLKGYKWIGQVCAKQDGGEIKQVFG